MEKERIAVVGGGITGLASAYALQKEIEKGSLNAEFNLYEAGSRLGGSISTDYTNGFVIERGPDSFLTRKRSMYDLAVELGMEEELVTNRSGAFILHGKKLHRIPEGAVMGIPTKWRPFLLSGLFSPKGKARAAMDLFLPRHKHMEKDQSVGSFFRRRLGSEVVDNLIEPLLSGIYAGNIDKISLQATFPQFLEVEKNHRSLILGMKTSLGNKAVEEPVLLGKNKKPAGMFLTFRSGLQSFSEKLSERLDQNHVHTNHKISSINKEGGGYRLVFENGSSDYADKILLTIRHHQAYELFKNHSFMEPLGKVPSTSVATVALAFDEKALKKPLDGTGFVVSKKSDYTITACTWTHQKWEHTAPKEKALLRAYVGRAGEEEVVDRTDEEIVDEVRKDLKKIMGIDEVPEFYRVTRWRQAMPQYEIDHVKRLEKINGSLAEHLPGIKLIGASYKGIGLPDCVNQANTAAAEIIEEQKRK
ncbi:protoporphyrinogen oxidase [Alkalicoccus halolimnae]|uniref:Coproporphyrinogen III oxidase n=1 Tax=Alkalicoccus halolimnae TaxID=1667239 RepID=A0A5C7FGU6_9BACI|nr:protoporphyrinogen oxidase [Alkalicoccus halolimnae]TXF86527.1 protoporphyrinogen oxidase [Alkalicoccus halolimnae]